MGKSRLKKNKKIKTPYELRMEDRKIYRERDLKKVGGTEINSKIRPKKSLGFSWRSKQEKEQREYYRKKRKNAG